MGSVKRQDQGPAYAETLTSVFMAIADIVQEHQQAVEEEFGPENFVVVVRGLLDEVPRLSRVLGRGRPMCRASGSSRSSPRTMPRR